LNLQTYDFPSYLDTSHSDLVRDFFVPALKNSIRYDRGVGFFSSGWLRITANGMNKFAENGGTARWVTSPVISKKDWDAMLFGEKARINPFLRKLIKINIEDLEKTLENETLSALAWMIADGILEFKFALPRNKLSKGDFHDKFGIFYDNKGNSVSFNGSYNDSIQGTLNYESIKIFSSWIEKYKDLVIEDTNRFNQLWDNLDPNVQVYDLLESEKEKIIRLRKFDRPYRKINTFPIDLSQKPLNIPEDIHLRDYQNDAICAWEKSNRIGLFEMATGTGKTITSIAASVRFFEEKKELALIVTCPYIHLVEQWKNDAEAFGYRPLLAFKSSEEWKAKINNKIIAFNNGDIGNLCIITTHSTFSTKLFQSTIARINRTTLLIADEAHHLGAESKTKYYPKNIEYRLALSATPDRWFDDAGSARLRNYFGKTVFEFQIGKAIKEGYLTEYKYFPVITELTNSEMENYQELSKKISKLFNMGEKPDENRILLSLLLKRSNILNSAENKLEKLSNLIDSQNEISHTLFYCAPGQLNKITSLLGKEKKIKIHKFTYKEDNKSRQRILNEFESGMLQGIVAIKCLDEGVDIPSTKTAYILASSSNPREFIQRRGRILRKSIGKSYAIVYDFITFPPLDFLENFPIERQIIRKELSRFKEFAQYAINFNSAYECIWEIAMRFNILDF